jgi:hypothetical protein
LDKRRMKYGAVGTVVSGEAGGEDNQCIEEE